MTTTNPLAATFAATINTEHEAARHAATSALAHARRAGELLNAVKGQLPHGEWLPWLAEHCPTIPERTAQAYMRIAGRWPKLEAYPQRVADLPVRQALLLLSGRSDDEASVDDQVPIDLSALRREHVEIERWHVTTMAELRVLDRARQSPDLTIKEAAAIHARAADLEQEGVRLQIESLAAIGRGLIAIDVAVPGAGATMRKLLACPAALWEFAATAEAGPLEDWPQRLSARIADLAAQGGSRVWPHLRSRVLGQRRRLICTNMVQKHPFRWLSRCVRPVGKIGSASSIRCSRALVLSGVRAGLKSRLTCAYVTKAFRAVVAAMREPTEW